MTMRTWLLAILGVVAAAAAVLSFSSLRDLARQCGFDSRIAWLLPVVVDAGAAGGSIVWLGVWAGDVARRFARALALSLLALSVVANAFGHALEAYGLQPPWWVVVAVSGIAPAVLGAVVHLAVLLGRIPVVVDEESVVPELDDDGPTSWWDTAPPAPPTSSDRASELIAEGIGRRRLAKELGVSEHEARQLLAASRHTGAGEGA